MKRHTTRFVLAGALALLSAALPSCRKGCYECEKGADFGTICRDDHPNQQSFDSAIDLLKANGYSCKKQ